MEFKKLIIDGIINYIFTIYNNTTCVDFKGKNLLKIF